MLGDLDLSLKPQTYSLYLAKPNKTTIAKLSESYNVNLKLKLGSINELEFTLPYDIDIHHELKRNPNIDKIKDRYLVKIVVGNYVEWFMINQISESMDDSKDEKRVHAFSLGYELTDKQIRSYEVTSYTATQVLSDALSQTVWNIDYIDAQFDLKYRSFSVSNKTVLDFVFEIAETFGALVKFDTTNRTVSLYNPDNIGLDKGLRAKYGKLLKSVEKVSNSDEMVTRLKVFGKDGLSIQRVNPSGTTFIENFSFFIYPFQRDLNGNIINHSDYWSDELCIAQLDYQDLLETKKGEFDNLLSQKTTLQEALTTKQNELTVLNEQLIVIQDNIDVTVSNGGSITTLLQQESSKKTEITTKQNEINQVNTDIANVDSQIATVQSQIAIENNFTPEQIQERNLYIIEKEITNENYFNDQDLYDYAISEFDKIRSPQLSIRIDMVNLLEIIEEQRNWDKLNLGDIITIIYDKLSLNVKAKIIEINFNFEDGSINLTISNVKEILTDQQKFLNDLYKSMSTSTTVNMDKYKWNQVSGVKTEVDNILNNKWESAKRAVTSGVNESVVVDRRGITITDSQDPLKFIRQTHGVIALTEDGGNTYGVAIDGSGVYAQRLIGQIIAGAKLTIQNESGTFLVDSNGVTVKDMDLSITRTDGKSKILENATDGIKIQKNTGTTSAPVWVDQLYIDINGVLTANELVTDKLKIKSGNDVLIDANTRTIDFSKFTTIAGRITATNIDATNLTVSSANITGTLIADAVSSNWVYAGNISANQITSQNSIQSGSLRAVDSNGVTRIGLGGASFGYYEQRFYDSNGIQVGTLSGTSGQMNVNGVKNLIIGHGQGGKIYVSGGSTIDFQNATVIGLNVVAKFG